MMGAIIKASDFYDLAFTIVDEQLTIPSADIQERAQRQFAEDDIAHLGPAMWEKYMRDLEWGVTNFSDVLRKNLREAKVVLNPLTSALKAAGF